MRFLAVSATVAALAVASIAPAPRAGSGGVTVALPRGWHALPAAWLASDKYTDPVTRVVVASAPIRWRDTGCQIASYAFPATAVAIVVVEWLRPAPGSRAGPGRPRRFTAENLPLHAAPAAECFDGPAGAIQFTVRGRVFQASLLLGRRAPRSLAVRARTVLDTLRVRL
jgi:hypothetical protein